MAVSKHAGDKEFVSKHFVMSFFVLRCLCAVSPVQTVSESERSLTVGFWQVLAES